MFQRRNETKNKKQNHKSVPHWAPLLFSHLSSTFHFTSATHFHLWFSVSALHNAVSAVLALISDLASHTNPSPAARLLFTQSRPLPATTATQLSPVSFMVGMRAGLLWLRIDLRESFLGSGRAQHRVSKRMNSWLGKKKKNLNYTGMWHMFVWRLQCAVHGSGWLLLQGETLGQTELVRPHVIATPSSFQCPVGRLIESCCVAITSYVLMYVQ